MLLHLYNSPRMVLTSIPCVPTARSPGQRFLKTEQFLKKNTLKTTVFKAKKIYLTELFYFIVDYFI